MRNLLRYKTGLRSDPKEDRETRLISSLWIVRELLRSLYLEKSPHHSALLYLPRIYRFLTTSRGFRKKRRWISSNSSPFCDVNIIKRPPAYLRAARKRLLQGGPIHAHTYDPQEAQAFREGKRNLEQGRKNYRSCPQWRRPNFTPQESSRPST